VACLKLLLSKIIRNRTRSSLVKAFFKGICLRPSDEVDWLMSLQSGQRARVGRRMTVTILPSML
jgi:hypothetical protein